VRFNLSMAPSAQPSGDPRFVAGFGRGGVKRAIWAPGRVSHAVPPPYDGVLHGSVPEENSLLMRNDAVQSARYEAESEAEANELFQSMRPYP
jgi:hypothetical protein